MKFLESVLELIKGSGAAEVSVAYREIAPGAPPESEREWSIDNVKVYHGASTVKVAVMMEAYRQAAMGRIRLDDPLAIQNSFVSIADGSSYKVDQENDSDAGLYAHVGGTATVSDLVRRMIVRSGNLATNLLIDLVGARATQEFMNKLGAPDVVLLRGMYDMAAYDAGMNNTVTARGLAHLLAKLARREVVSPRDSDAMIDILLDQEYNEGIPAGLAPDTRVAHKTGWNGEVYHDAAIIDPYGPQPKVLVILTSGLGEMAPSGAFAAALTREIVEG